VSADTLHPIRLEGELTVQTAAEQKTYLLAALQASSGIELDLSEIAEIDTAGLQLLLLLKREATQLGQGLKLISPSAPVIEVLKLAWIDAQLEQIVPTELRQQ
jgi:anti-anti-sigma factor